MTNRIGMLLGGAVVGHTVITHSRGFAVLNLILPSSNLQDILHNSVRSGIHPNFFQTMEDSLTV